MNEAAVELTAGSAAALQSFFAFGVVFVCVALGALAGLRQRLFRSILSCGGLVVATIAAYIWGEGFGNVLQGFGVSEGWSLVAGYGVVLALVLALVGMLLRLLVRAEVMTYATMVDRLGGALIGVATGVLLASAVRVGFAMAPVSAAARPTPHQLQGDVTPRLLRMVSRILSSDPEVRHAWLHGSGRRVENGAPSPNAVTWSEPFVDLDANGQFDGKEPFLDKDGNGVFTEVFAERDPAARQEVRIGVMDRYWLGNWQLVRVTESK
jgi:hypothetical protein